MFAQSELYGIINSDRSNYQERIVIMSQRLSIGKPKREGPFQDFPLVNTRGMSVSDWVETLPVVEDDFNDNTCVNKIGGRKAEISKRKAEITDKLAKLDCIKNALLKMSGVCIESPIEESCSVEEIDQKEIPERALELQPEELILEPIAIDECSVKTEILQKKESIWTRVKKRTNDLYYKAGMYVGKAMLAAGELSAGKMMAKPEMKLGENLAEYERRVQRIGMAKVIGLTVLSSVAVHGFKDVFDAMNNNYANTGGHINHTFMDNALNSNCDAINNEIAPSFSFDAYNVTPGEGLFDTMNQMGITDTAKQYAILQKVGPELQNMNLVYPVGADSWGISSSGQLPKDALDLIWNYSKDI